MKVASLKVFLIFLAATAIIYAANNIIIESPLLAKTLGSLSEYTYNSTIRLNVYTNKTITQDFYNQKGFIPDAVIMLLDTGVRYNSAYFACPMNGIATASLIKYLEAKGVCETTGTTSLYSIVQTFINILGYNPALPTTDGSYYKLPDTMESFDYCITTSQKLQEKGFNITNTPTVDTVIIMQPSASDPNAWQYDLVGHGTMVAGALCGQGSIPVQGLADTYVGVYTGAARGAPIIVVNTETIAIILKNYVPPSTSSWKGVTPETLIAGGLYSGKLTTNDILIDADFRYLGPDLASLATLTALQDAAQSPTIQNIVANKKLVIIPEVASIVPQQNATTWCYDMANAINALPASIKVVVAPLGNNNVDLGQQLNNLGLYVWPAQCPDLITQSASMTIPVNGYHVTVNATNAILQGRYYGNYDENSSVTWFTAPAVMNSTSHTATLTLKLGTTSYNVVINFNAVPLPVATGTIMFPVGTYGNVGMDGQATYDSTTNTINIVFSGVEGGTSLAAAYAAAPIALALADPNIVSFDTLINNLHSFAPSYVSPFTGWGAIRMDQVWNTLVHPNVGTLTFPINMPVLGVTYPSALPASSEGSYVYNMMPSSTATTTTAAPIESTTARLQVKVPAPALIALLPPLALKRRKKGSKNN